MNKIEDKKKINAVVLLFSAVYMVSYITRINYGAIISEMQSAMQVSKSLLSMALTGSSVTYGFGQIISGIYGDKFPPKKMITFGLGVTVLMNFLILLCKTPYQMLIVWSINGFAQSFMWPPIVKMMTALLSEENYRKTVARISWGASVGTIIVYLGSPLFISLWGWKSVFAASAGIGIVMIFIWNRFAYDVKAEHRREKAAAAGSGSFITPVMLCIMLAIVLQGMLRDGVTTWTPSFISETYHLSNEVSILSGVVLPIFSIISLQLATRLYTRRIKNPLSCSALFFAVSTLSTLGLILLSAQSAGLSVFFLAVLIGCMHGVNLMLISMISPHFAKVGRVSTVSGVLNSCTYIGSAISTYGIAFLSERFGWSFATFSWLAVAALGSVICLLCSRGWKKYLERI